MTLDRLKMSQSVDFEIIVRIVSRLSEIVFEQAIVAIATLASPTSSSTIAMSSQPIP